MDQPKFVYQGVIDEFKAFAEPILGAKAEPLALVLVVPWELDAPYPPGAVATRSGHMTPRELLACAKQCRVMSERLYGILADRLAELDLELGERANQGRQSVGLENAGPQKSELEVGRQ